MKRPCLFFLLLVLSEAFALKAQAVKVTTSRPKLVVGIVVDQMRNDFIYRYWDRYGENGFKKLVNGGYYFRNTHFNYIPTYTGPGHCSIYTGATPRAHGIIANNWFVKRDKSKTYCAYDHGVNSVGSDGNEGKMSPRNQLASTIGDEMKMSSNRQSKVFAIALKDRGAVLPGGHAADGAFWMEYASAKFISSDYYMKELPAWLNDFNAKNPAREYLAKGWQTLYPLATYTSSLSDDNRYESGKLGNEKPVFPYQYKNALEKNDYGFIRYSPYANTLTTDLAIACLRAEKLGKGNTTDLLCISFSAPDIIGHEYSPRSVEMEDLYLRLDNDIAALLEALDRELGKNNYTVFLTADHGAADVPNHLKDLGIPAGFVYESVVAGQLKTFMQRQFGDSLLILNVSNDQVFLDEQKIRDRKLQKDLLEQEICDYLVGIPGIAEAFPSIILKNGASGKNDYPELLRNGYNHKLSGNIAYICQPGYMDHGHTGTSHGSGYIYDTHVPLIFYGAGVKKGESLQYTTITQIAPTICELLKINRPNACTAQPLNELIK
jgi:predicted AlkP superfamily pyrophosphatase or phosphodiesterase